MAFTFNNSQKSPPNAFQADKAVVVTSQIHVAGLIVRTIRHEDRWVPSALVMITDEGKEMAAIESQSQKEIHSQTILRMSEAEHIVSVRLNVTPGGQYAGMPSKLTCIVFNENRGAN